MCLSPQPRAQQLRVLGEVQRQGLAEDGRSTQPGFVGFANLPALTTPTVANF